MTGNREAREAILARIRSANAHRDTFDHPGPFEAWRPTGPPETDVDAFVRRFESVGGEAHRVGGREEARAWLAHFTGDYRNAAYGTGVGEEITRLLPAAPAESAEIAVSKARAAIAETGSLVMDARDGRRVQLLCPTHVVLVDAATVTATARAEFADLAEDLPSAVGLHSGPSKSADIGQVMVKGVHGPARVIALIIEERSEP